LFDDGQPVTFDPSALARVVGHQTHRADTDVVEDLGSDPVIAGVDGQPEMGVRIDRVKTLVLEYICGQFVEQPHSPALMTQDVEDDPTSYRGDIGQGQVELLATIATQASEDISGQTFRVDPG